MDLSDILNINKEKVIQSKSILNEIQKHKDLKFVLPLGLKYFDKSILNGGFYPNKKYIIFGTYKAGKTQLCHQICVQAFKFFSKNIDSSNKKKAICTIYLDTENTFRPERIKEIASASNLDYVKIFKTINVAKIMSNSSFLLKLKEIKEKEQLENVKVLIIDSINNHYRSEQKKSTFLKILSIIDEIARFFNLTIIATAQVSPNFITNAIIKELPVGNLYLNHFFSEYLYLGIKEEKNYMHIVNSHLFPEKKVSYKITSKGIEDYEI